MAPTGLLGFCGLLCAWGAAAAGRPCGLHHQVGAGAWDRCAGGGVPDDCRSTAGGTGKGSSGLLCCRLQALLVCSDAESLRGPGQKRLCARFASLQGAPAYTWGDTVTAAE